jgi:hypothetical protein
MKRYLNLFILTLAVSATAAASNTFCTAALSTYVGGGSCTFGGFTINDFTFVGVDVLGNSLAPKDITVSTSIDSSGNPTVTFTPDSAFAVSILGVETYLFGFDLTSNTANIDFSKVNLDAQGSVHGVGLLGATTTATVAEQDCYGGAIIGKENIVSLGNGGLACLGGGLSAGVGVALGLGANVDASAGLEFSGTSASVDVLKEVVLTTVLGGSASISGIEQAFTITGGAQTNSGAVPEPGSFFLGGCGLILVALGRLQWKIKRQGK